MTDIIIYCDGGCRNNQQKENLGAWACSLQYGNGFKMLSGIERNTTNNKMELLSCIKALEAITDKTIPVRVTSDSKYLVEGINTWIYAWIRDRWKKSDGKLVINQELWMQLFKLKISFHDIMFNHCKGHIGVDGNELVDLELNRVMDEEK
jgi:ribonuclease HI